jgi:hypothetical protein
MRKGPKNRIVGLPVLGTARALVGPGSAGRRMLALFGIMLLGGVAFVFGRSIGQQTVTANPPPPTTNSTGMPSPYPAEYEGRVVAYIYNNEPIRREELAEYLIARFGADRLEFFVNRIIIERACKEKQIFITDAEIENQFRKDLTGIGGGITEQIFQKEILSRYHKTVFEWKEDVIRPKLMLTALCRPTIHLSEADLQEGFEARYGPKVKCRMILCRDQNEASTKWTKIEKSGNIEAAFLTEAGQQGQDPRLASVKGEIPPIHKHFGDPRIEKEAFRLKPGEMSQVLEMADHTAIILLCERHMPAESLVRFENVRLALEADMTEIRLAEKMNSYLKELRKQAQPRYLLSKRQTLEQVEWDAHDRLKQTELQYRSQK